MPDWKKEVRERMPSLNLPPDMEHEIIAELASHLEDGEIAACHEGADARAFSAAEWRRIAAAIERTKRKGTPMKNRVKSLWLPSAANFALMIALLLLFDRFNWQEPGVATPGHVGRAFRTPFLLILPALGALGAFLAKRAQASRHERLIAGLVPSLLWLAVLVVLGIPLALDPRDFAGIPMSYLGLSALGLVILPALLLLLGALPFLRNLPPGPQHSTKSAA